MNVQSDGANYENSLTTVGTDDMSAPTGIDSFVSLLCFCETVPDCLESC